VSDICVMNVKGQLPKSQHGSISIFK